MKVERHYEDFRIDDGNEKGGIISLSGSFLLDHENEIVNLINHEGKLAEQRNPDHKVSKIEKVDGGMVAQITDHNLTMHIGKSLVNAYKGEHEYKFSKGEKFVRVNWKRDS
ncbi:MAG: hypothetical protein ABIH50_03665 [bacterium]